MNQNSSGDCERPAPDRDENSKSLDKFGPKLCTKTYQKPDSVQGIRHNDAIYMYGNFRFALLFFDFDFPAYPLIIPI